MRDRVVFFLLGATVATIAYFVGDMKKVDAQNNTRVFDNVHIKGELLITGGGLIIRNNEDLSRVDVNTFGVLVRDDFVGIALENYVRSIRAGEPSSRVLIGAFEDENGSKSYMGLMSNRGKFDKLISSEDIK